MFNRIHQKLGTAGFIVSIVALVAALGGGAYAASGGLNGKQKKEVEKIAKKFAGKPGVAGATGPAGPAGAKGDAGAPGANGTGTTGANGTSVTGAAIPVGNAECASKAGGVKYTSASGTNAVCNGKDGTTGFTSTLPSEKTETGTWSVTIPKEVAGISAGYSPISFTIPLAAALPEANVKIEPEGYTGSDSECPGTAAEAKAEPGFLCVYTIFDEITALVETPASTTPGGVVIETFAESEEGHGSYGTWAVTAP